LIFIARKPNWLELDGRQHYDGNGPAHDQERTKFLEGRGLHVIRFTNADVEQNFAQVCEEIERQLRA